MPKVPVTLMIGAGSKVPVIYKNSLEKNANYFINLIITHKKDAPGIDFALSKKIPAVYFNLVSYKKTFGSNKNTRSTYMQNLGWFIKQYNPKLLIFVGWDLIVDENFLQFFKAKIGDGFCAINLHPALLPFKNEKKLIKLPDGTFSPIIKGQQEEVLEFVLKNKLSYFGATVHFMKPNKFDTGSPIERKYIKVAKSKTIPQLRKKLISAENKILISSINKVIRNI